MISWELTIGTQCDIHANMKYFSWDPAKNEKLKAERNISFEEIVFYIERGQVLDILEHPNKKKYPNQFIFIIPVEDYVYLVPFVEGENEIILKTIIPSRKATKQYLKGGDENERNDKGREDST